MEYLQGEILLRQSIKKLQVDNVLIYNKKMKRDTLIFDLDGTLLNTLDDLYISFNYAIKSFGYPERTLEEIKSFVGNGIKTAIERALPHKIQDEELEKIVCYFKIYYKDHMYERTQPYNGVIELLEYLKKSGYKIGIFSNKYDAAVQELNNKFFKEYSNAVLGEVSGIERKPNPAGLLKLIDQLNSSLEKTIYIGDSEVDIKTAQNANIPCISVLWGYKEKDFLVKNGGKIFVSNPNEIIKILDNFEK